METVPSPGEGADAALSFDVGSVRVIVLPSPAGHIAYFLLYRTRPASCGWMLIGSGYTLGTASCIERATSAAQSARSIG